MIRSAVLRPALCCLLALLTTSVARAQCPDCLPDASVIVRLRYFARNEYRRVFGGVPPVGFYSFPEIDNNGPPPGPNDDYFVTTGAVRQAEDSSSGVAAFASSYRYTRGGFVGADGRLILSIGRPPRDLALNVITSGSGRVLITDVHGMDDIPAGPRLEFSSAPAYPGVGQQVALDLFTHRLGYTLTFDFRVMGRSFAGSDSGLDGRAVGSGSGAIVWWFEGVPRPGSADFMISPSPVDDSIPEEPAIPPQPLTGGYLTSPQTYDAPVVEGYGLNDALYFSALDPELDPDSGGLALATSGKGSLALGTASDEEDPGVYAFVALENGSPFASFALPELDPSVSYLIEYNGVTATVTGPETFDFLPLAPGGVEGFTISADPHSGPLDFPTSFAASFAENGMARFAMGRVVPEPAAALIACLALSFAPRSRPHPLWSTSRHAPLLHPLCAACSRCWRGIADASR